MRVCDWLGHRLPSAPGPATHAGMYGVGMDVSKWARYRQSLRMVYEIVEVLYTWTAPGADWQDDGMTGWEIWSGQVEDTGAGSYELFKKCLKDLVEVGYVVWTGEWVDRGRPTKTPSLAAKYYKLDVEIVRYWKRHGEMLLHPEDHVRERYLEWRNGGRDGVWRRIPEEFVGQCVRDESTETGMFMRLKSQSSKGKARSSNEA